MDIRSLFAAQSYAASRPATEAQPKAGMDGMIRAGVEDFAATLAEAETAAQNTMAGDADPHALVTALAQSELAVETVVTVRDRVVEAYQEILRMPV
ncbi:flagellar hook-basal body complex protein FliE [Roseivivax lentus]|uniref:Flagellar hook-basal body complex protein FliE n=1 Tax=Roseivivax lentus TaxID=633194 RepID=A0A1N7JLC2_9RHOB|nr:flagellar hook-basal body complex protein FliE [Roseivivax lentus]SIS50051.1 flagellar hook-basal body complex protein FliE [Roseivivax lentus]